ncbi:aromatic ring-hydroxylating dioxygenase subunit alpha [soil metagenome]
MSRPTASTTEEITRLVRESVGPVASARTLPAECYYSPDFYEFERDAIFGRSWLFLCHESQVPLPGDHLPVTVAAEPLLVTRGRDAQVHVVSAVCQHRGFVITDPGLGSDGTVTDEVTSTRHLRCPYHFWTYDFDGRLTSAPSMSDTHELDALKATICLPKMRVEIWHGLIFANQDPDAAPLAPTVQAADAAITPYRLEDMVVAETVTLTDLPFNWKNMQENALEEYHTTYVHKGFHENVPANLVEHGSFEPGDGAVYRHAGMIIPGGQPVPGRPTFPVIEGLPEYERGQFLFLSIPPLLFAAVRPDGVKMFRIVPQAVDRISLTIMFLFPRTTLELPDFAALLQRQVDLIPLIDQPDIDSNTRMFTGLRSKFAPRGPFSPQESSLPQFNQWLLDRYSAASEPETVDA